MTEDVLPRFWKLLDAVPVPGDAERLYDEATEAGARRRRNLTRYLRLARGGGEDRILVGEAPGWRGMTVTGVPFYSVREAETRPGLLSGSPDGDGMELPPDPAALWEASARDVWQVLARRRGPLPLSWPIYPHHPHEPGRPHTNRTPRAAEVRAGTEVTLALIEAFGGPDLIAVGRKAQGALAAAGLDAPVVRHPAQGGARLFADQLAALGI